MENPFNVEKPVRPTFLTVLCILTFIGSGWGLINNLFQLAMLHQSVWLLKFNR